MTKDYAVMTMDELLDCVINDAVKAPAIRELKKRRERNSRKVDRGTFFPGQYSPHEGYWCCAKDSKVTRAKLHGEAWEEFKRNNPDWEKRGKE